MSLEQMILIAALKFPTSHLFVKLAANLLSSIDILPALLPLTSVESDDKMLPALIISQIDYCNSVLYGLTAITLAPLQRVLHANVRLVPILGYHDHVTPAMKELHWLPIAHCIKYKLCLMMHAAVHNRSLEYITDIHRLCFTE